MTPAMRRLISSGNGCQRSPRAQARLDVADAAARIEGGQGRRRDGGRVTLDEHPVGPLVEQDRLEPSQHRRGDLGRRLVVLHDVQVVVGLDAEDAQHLVEHVAVLGGDADATGDAIRVAGELANDGPELDGFGAGAEDGQDLQAASGGTRRSVGHASDSSSTCRLTRRSMLTLSRILAGDEAAGLLVLVYVRHDGAAAETLSSHAISVMPSGAVPKRAALLLYL